MGRKAAINENPPVYTASKLVQNFVSVAVNGHVVNALVESRLFGCDAERLLPVANISSGFQVAKQNNDSIPNIPIPDNSQDINKPFSLKELEIAISHQKEQQSGHDKISLQTINHLSISQSNKSPEIFNDS
ncbi:hypothetical protein TNCV_3928031 [Trichonephila clavipes]|nr:hypothetical protein TNCV_3928031 [Trichonephila clavipes]